MKCKRRLNCVYIKQQPMDNESALRVLGEIQRDPLFSAVKAEIVAKIKLQRFKELTRHVSDFQKNPESKQIAHTPITAADFSTKLNKLLSKSGPISQKFRLTLENHLFMHLYKANSRIDEEDNRKNFERLTAKYAIYLVTKLEDWSKRAINEVKQDFLSELETRSIIDYFVQFKDDTFATLKVLSSKFVSQIRPDITQIFEELDYDRYEHIEQKEESETIEIERIQEGLDILETLEKSEDDEEILSFFKGGIPHDIRSKMYVLYYQTCEQGKSKKSKNNEEPLSEELAIAKVNLIELVMTNIAAVEEAVAAGLSKRFDLPEYFPYETMARKMIKYYIKHFERFIQDAGKRGFGFLPYRTIDAAIIISSIFSTTLKTCQMVFRLIYNRVVSTLLDFTFSNTGSILSLCLYFENEFILRMNHLYLHLKIIGIDPVSIASEWIADLFVGRIKTTEVLYFVDRILGFESLLLLPLLSLGVFKHYEKELLESSTIEEVESVLFLGDLDFIKTINKVLKERVNF